MAHPHFSPYIAVAALFSTLALPTQAWADQPDQTFSFEDQSGATIEAGVWLPDPDVNDGSRPLIVISHGNGGWYQGHHDTAEALAAAGFVVAALTHPGDNFRDQSRATLLTARPVQLSALIDYMTTEWSGSAIIDDGRIGAFGFSAGGFTVTTAIGGISDPATITDHCAAHPDFFACRLYAQLPVNPAEWRPEAYDRRIRAAVIAAPALGFAFAPDSLASITVPVQLWQAASDEILPAPYNVEPIRNGLGRPPEFHLVANAKHFDFLTPCTPEAGLPSELCASNPNFDRAVFKVRFNQTVVRFFSDYLQAG